MSDNDRNDDDRNEMSGVTFVEHAHGPDGLHVPTDLFAAGTAAGTPDAVIERLGRNELASVPQTFARWSRTLEAYGVELEMGASVLDDWRKESSAPAAADYGMPHVVSVACVEATRHLRAAAESLVRAQVELGKIDGVIAASIAKR